METSPAELLQEAEKTIRTHAVLAGAAGLIPVPALDVAAVTAIQMHLMKDISRIYGHTYDPSQLNVVLSSLLTALGGKMASWIASSTFDLFKSFGDYRENITNGVVAAMVTYGTGEILCNHIESGGTLEDLSYENYLDYYSTQFQEGKIGSGGFDNVEKSLGGMINSLLAGREGSK